MTAMFEIVTFAVCASIAIAGALGMTTTMSMFRSGIFLMASFIGVAGLFILLAADLIGVLQIMMYIGGFLVMILFMVLVMHDPGGAMMAGMDMALIERWFSKGLAPRGHPHGGHMHDDHKDGHGSDREKNNAAEHAGGGGHERHSMQHGAHAAPDHQSMQHGDDNGDEGHAMHDNDGKHSGMDMSEMAMVTPVRAVAAWLAVAVGIMLVGMLLLRPAWRVVDALPDPDSARRIGELLMEKYMVAFEGAGFLILIGIFGAVLLARPSTYPDGSSRSAKVAVDKRPEPIADDGVPPLRHSQRADEHGERRQPPKEQEA